MPGRRFASLAALLVTGPIAAQTPSVPTADTRPQVAAVRAEVLDRHIALHVRGVTLEAALDAVAAAGHVRVLYSPSRLPLAQIVSLSADSITIGDALDTLLNGTGVGVSVSPEGWVLLGETNLKRQGLGWIQGFLFDSATKLPLTYVTLTIDETGKSGNTGPHTDYLVPNLRHGTYHINARRVGYVPQTRAVVVDNDTAAARLDFYLAPQPSKLQEVVTTATGPERRYEVGNDITVLNVDSVTSVAPIASVTELLATRVPGLTVQPTSGVPGAPARLRLRGMSSIERSDDPIIIVDGVRIYYDQSGSYNNQQNATSGGGSAVGTRVATGTGLGYFGPAALDQIDPNSLESVEVMKGPSASALYGSDAANGVIIITTKRGRPGPTRWNLTVDNGFETQPGRWPTNYYRFGHGIGLGSGGSQLCSIYDGPQTCTTDSIVPFQALNDTRYSPLGTGLDQAVSLGASGGNGPVTFAVSGNIGDRNGYLHLPSIEVQRFDKFHTVAAPGWMKNPDTYTTWGAASNLRVLLGKSGASLSLSSNLYHSQQQQSSLQTALPILGSNYIDTTQLATQPLIAEYYERARLTTLTFTNALTLGNWSPIRWLPLDLTVGLNVQSLNNTSLTPRGYVLYSADSLGTYMMNQSMNVMETISIGTHVQVKFLTLATGFNIQNQTTQTLANSTDDLPLGVSVPNTFVCNGLCGSLISQGATTYGWYIQPSFNFSRRLYVSPGFRLDGGTASGSNHSLTFFPKIDVSYIAVERTNHPMFGFLSTLRPRLAFGIAGVQPAPGDKLRLFLPGTVVGIDPSGGAGTPVSTLTLGSIGNTRLQPERSRELEGGVDVDLWSGRVSFSATGYQKMRYDAILDVPLAPSAVGDFGNDQQRNVGTVENTGINLQATILPIELRAITWSITGLFSQNTNSVKRLEPGQPPIKIVGATGGSTYYTEIKPGFPIDGIWARPILSYADANHDGYIEPGEVRLADSAVFLGEALPKYEASLSTGLGLFGNRIMLNTAFDYQHHLTQVNVASPLGLEVNQPNATFGLEAAVAAGGQSAYGEIQTVNVLRWNTASVAYNVPERFVRWFRATSMSIALQASNLALWTSYRGKDPAVNVFGNGNLTADTGQLPLPRMYSVHFSLGI
ncbi:MAG TPA: TonB-dependent receptor plug domain-containing protein [Gemmatimonadaceae bacterium]|nr:TonB-dependent receptor plug domain-containing protein [Gemmatimonadaceae bacterium]